MLTKLLLVAALAATAVAQFDPRIRTTNRQIGGRQLITQPRTITLDDGQLLQIDARTLRRLEQQGVDIGTLDNLSDAELQRLGISIRAVTIAVPGAVQRLDGIQEIRLPSGVILEIDQATLRRLQNQGVDITTIPNLSESELRRLGIRIREESIIIPGAVQLAGGEQQIRLSNGIIVVIDRATLQRLQSQGVDVNSIPNLTPAEARRLGIRIREETIIIPGAIQLGNGQQEFVLSNGAVVTVTQSVLRQIQEQGVDVTSLTTLTEAELRRLGLIPRVSNVRIPGATVLPNGAQQIRLRNGVLLNIDQATLRRLLAEGVDINTIPNLSEQELQALGIRVTESITSSGPIPIPGAIRLPDGSLQLRLRNGVVVVIDQTTLQRLQLEGVDLTTIPNLSRQELIALGIQVTETVTSSDQPLTIPGAVRLPNGNLQIRLRNGALIVIDQQTLRRLRVEGVNLNTIPNLSQEELRILGIRVTESVIAGQPIVIPGAVTLPGGSLQIRLRNGVLVVIDQQTLRRLRVEGVDLNTLPNLSQQELAALGIRVTETVTADQPLLDIPGAIRLPNGNLQIRLRNGALIVIDQQTLRRLRVEGVNLNTIPNLSPEELRILGIRVTETVTSGQPIIIPGAVTLPGGSLQIRLRNGVLVVIDQQTLRRLRVEGVDLNTLPNLNQQELAALGIRVTETVTADQPLRPGVTRRIYVDGQTIVVPYATLIRLQNEGIDINNLQSLTREELIRLRVISSGLRPLYPRPQPQDEGSLGGEVGQPRPEPFNFAYTSETEDGSSSSHQATQTADGVVTGSYTIRDANGQERRVDYVADAGGYRATVTTNEIGTESQNTADAVYQSSAPTAAELSRQYTPRQPLPAVYRPEVGRPYIPVGRRVYQGQRLAPLPAVRVDQSRAFSGRLTAAPEADSAPATREPAASEAAGVQYTEDSREFETIKIAA